MKIREADKFPRRHDLATALNCKRKAKALSSEAREERIKSSTHALINMESYVQFKK